MLGAWIDHIFIDLVRNGHHVELLAQVGHKFKLFTSEHLLEIIKEVIEQVIKENYQRNVICYKASNLENRGDMITNMRS